MNHKIYRLKLSGVKFVAVTLVKFDYRRKQNIKFAAVFWVKFKYRPVKRALNLAAAKITPESKFICTRLAASALKISAFFV